MKLGSLKNGRDGQLVVVRDDLESYVPVPHICATLQQALDNWAVIEPKLRDISDKLNKNEVPNAKGFEDAKMASPLPRAYQIADGSAYLNHVELVRKARGAEMPPEFLHDPLMYQAVSDTILAPCDDIPVSSEEFGIDFEAEVAVIVDDVPMGISADDAQAHIKLVMLMNDVSLRGLIPQELGKGFGFFQSKPPSAFSPVAITPDALGAHWKNGKLCLPLVSSLNGQEVGRPNAGVDMQFDFGQLIAHAARTRPLSAGAIIGSGTISNYDRAAGISCIAEIRMIEKIEQGDFKTPFLKFGDRVRIEMLDENGKSIFGAIDQKVVRYAADNLKDKKAAHG
jgi:fumarylacetoacetate (FAA) hydrolase